MGPPDIKVSLNEDLKPKKCNLISLYRRMISCWLRESRSFEDLKEEFKSDESVQFTQKILFANWPQGEAYPKEFDEILENVFLFYNTVVKNAFGLCDI